ncbi:MAG TPA: hypothetical protein VFR59_08645 [Steroidobacteraceae bacterium]|nr:hypothetical protein [Steroidobacteraceae bacterium]
MKSQASRLVLFCAAGILAATQSFAAAEGSTGKPERKIGQYSGFEGREAELGKAVGDAIASVSATKGPEHQFAGREQLLGKAVSTAIKTINHNRGYQHETNDALVKMTLDHIQVAKKLDAFEAVLDQDLHSTRKQLERVGGMIQKTGNKDLAIVGVFEQTTCFFQLVEQTTRSPGKITYQSPFGRVLSVTRLMGIHDLTEEEIHNRWTIPRLQRYAKTLGVEFDVSPWQADGVITVSVK